MPATIIGSVVVSQEVQKDGRSWVTERFTDSLGAVWTTSPKLVDSNWAAAEQLPLDAASFLTQLASNEIAADLQIALANSGTMTFNYATQAQVQAALIAALGSLTGYQLVNVSTFLSNNSALVGATALQAVALRNAMTAAINARASLATELATITGTSVGVS